MPNNTGEHFLRDQSIDLEGQAEKMLVQLILLLVVLFVFLQIAATWARPEPLRGMRSRRVQAFHNMCKEPIVVAMGTVVLHDLVVGNWCSKIVLALSKSKLCDRFVDS